MPVECRSYQKMENISLSECEYNVIKWLSERCMCPVPWIVGRIHLEDQDGNVWQPERKRSVHFELESSSDDADPGEGPWSFNCIDDEDPTLDGKCIHGWYGGWADGWYGRPGGRLNRRRYGCRGGRMSCGRTGGRDATPCSSFSSLQLSIVSSWEMCCKWNDVPEETEDWITAVTCAAHNDYHEYMVNGGDSDDFGEGAMDSDQAGHPSRAPSSRRHRPRVVRGTEWF